MFKYSDFIPHQSYHNFFLFTTHQLSLWNHEKSRSNKIFTNSTSPEAFSLNSSSLHTFTKWEKWGNINENILVNCSPNANTLTKHDIGHVKILFSLLSGLNIIAYYCYETVNIFYNGAPVHSRVNLVHFKGAHLDPYETYRMKLTC